MLGDYLVSVATSPHFAIVFRVNNGPVHQPGVPQASEAGWGNQTGGERQTTAAADL